MYVICVTNYAEAETPILWPQKNWLIGKDPNAGKDRRQEEKGMTEDEMVGWHHWLNGHEFEQALGVGDGQGSLACCSSWACKESKTTEQLNWTDMIFQSFSLLSQSPLLTFELLLIHRLNFLSHLLSILCNEQHMVAWHLAFLFLDGCQHLDAAFSMCWIKGLNCTKIHLVASRYKA